MGDLARCDVWTGLSENGLRDALHSDVSSNYRPISVQLDLGGNPNRYTTARQIMFTAVERQVDDAGQGELECIYTGFKAFAPADRDPDRDALNCEHVWPRSRMVPEVESPALYEHQQSDIHTLMPPQPDANSSRGSLQVWHRHQQQKSRPCPVCCRNQWFRSDGIPAPPRARR